MTLISSDTYTISSSLESVHAYLSNPGNLEGLLPKDKFSDFVSTAHHCQFKISGGIEVSLYLSDLEGDSRISYHHGKESSFNYFLHIDLLSNSDQVQATFQFEYDAPPFVSMMVKGPLTALMKDMAEQLVSKLNREG